MSLVVRVIAPTGRDAQLITEVLQHSGLEVQPCTSLASLEQDAVEAVTGPLVIAEEALSPAFVQQLGAILDRQPHWSDLPILILTSSGKETLASRRLAHERLPLGSPVLLERPIRTASLVSSVQAALRARQRQYEIRDAFEARDRAHAELKSERETLQAVLDNLPVGILLARPSGEVVLGNRSLEMIFRHPVLATADTEAHGDWVAFHSDGRQVKGEEYPLPRAMKERRAVPAEDFLYQRGDGTKAWVRLVAAPILNQANEVTGGVVAVSDIDQEKRAEESLRRSEERFRKLIENASIGVNIGDFDGRLRYMNPGLLKLTGYTAEEVEQGQVDWKMLTPPEYAEADRLAMEQLRATGSAEPYRKEYRAKDGKRIPLLLGATLIPGEPASQLKEEIAVFLTDLTSQQKAEAALVQSEKLAAVGRLAASISHEINNPLEAVTNLLYLVRQHEGLPDHVQHYLDSADSQLTRVSQIVSQTLRFHRQSTKPRALTPDELLEPALALYSGRIANAHIDLKLEKRGARPVTCYEGDIRQVLNNLIGNAIDAMRSGGRLVVRTSNARLWKTGVPGIRITIADTGHGMPSSVLHRIFEAFYTTKGNNGTGLGLWISLGIVEKHRSRLQVRSKTGEDASGTVFSLLMPLHPAIAGQS